MILIQNSKMLDKMNKCKKLNLDKKSKLNQIISNNFIINNQFKSVFKLKIYLIKMKITG